MLKTITQKNTRNGLSGELCALPRREQNKGATAKDTEMIVVRRSAMKTLTRATIMKTRGRLQVNKINCSADSVNPEVRWKKSAKKKSTSHLQDVTVLALSNPVLRMSPRTG